ncbi:hypothetical protein B296_00001752 [Ensete ventricosum]|uniref:Uncharacterized protein n=1 Tax=Ensete ventricosum TaxID=4639 RepID=A0A427A358_ENSVE|nr:hypothetical protein B296_00001752 [Ensete ventricosum]
MPQECPSGNSNAEHRTEPNHPPKRKRSPRRTNSKPLLEDDDRPGVLTKEVLKSKGEFGESSKGGSPFTHEIQDKPLPTNFRLPSHELYDDSCDPAEHVTAFRTQMALYDTSDALICVTKGGIVVSTGNTKEYRDLQSQIEDLIQQGQLYHYVCDQSSFPDGRPPIDPSPRPKGPVKNQIDVIIGGSASSDDSSSAHKAYACIEVGKRPAHEEDLDITFRSGNEEYPNHDDALVIAIRMVNARVKRVMIDMRSSVDILYFDAFQKLRLTNKDLVSLTFALTGFIGDSVSPLGAVTIPVTFGEEPKSKTLMVSFMVVGLPSTYNAIIRRPTLNRLKAVISTYHRIMKSPIRAGVGEARSDPRESKQCYLMATMLSKRPKVQTAITAPRSPKNSARDPNPMDHGDTF